jgi:hypothetical protein
MIDPLIFSGGAKIQDISGITSRPFSFKWQPKDKEQSQRNYFFFHYFYIFYIVSGSM